MNNNSRMIPFALVLCLLITICSPATFGAPDDAFSRQTKLVDPNAEAIGGFGVAIDVDGDTAVVTRLANFFTGLQGAAHIYVRDGENWTLQQTVSEQDNEPMAGDGYGFSVALEGDTLVVGAIGDSDGAFAAGAAYVYVRNGTTWSLQQKLTAADAASFSNFGISVDVLDDTVVVGAHLTDAAYVFHRDGTLWTQQQKLAPTGGPEQSFGISVSISGQTIAVGASTHSAPGAQFAGAVYVFVNNGSSWDEQQRLTANNVKENQNLGFTVAISGDTIVASAPGELVGAPNNETNGVHKHGAAYVFERTGTSWDHQKRFFERDSNRTGGFALRLAIDGDTIVVGDVSNNQVGLFAGAGYVYVRNGNAGWSLKHTLTANDGGPGDSLGLTVAISGDTIILGAPQQNNLRGAAYIFE